ncbi:hypothetical protein HK104_000754 [Borealophlyctis nickersoniae]|nr:hypothetical protein HK104_000754 [Borealophlyctis nickersoniae]
MLPQEQVVLLLNTELPTLDALSDVHSLLRKESERKLAVTEKAAHVAQHAPRRIQSLLTEAKNAQSELQQLQRTRADIAHRLREHMTHQEEGDMLQYLSTAQSKLRKLRAAREYLGVLLKVDELSAKARQEMDRSAKAALAPYDELCSLWTSIKEEWRDQTSPAVENDAGKQIVASLVAQNALGTMADFVRGSALSLHEELLEKLSRKLEQALEGLGWPNPINIPAAAIDKLEPFRKAFGDLLLLRTPDVVAKDGTTTDDIPSPINVMLKMPILHFKYHFQGNKPTNRLDKPEWAFTRVLTVIRDHTAFLCGPVQTLMVEYGYGDYDAKNEFTRGLLRAVTTKLRSDAPKLLQQPHLFSHAINETLLFDKSLRDVHLYVPRNLPAGTEWKGCVNVFTENPEWFRAWLGMELQAAKDRFDELIRSPDALDLAYESMSDIDDLRLTKSAEGFVTLLEAVTDRYKLLPNLAHRLAFFGEIQLTLLEDYLQHAHEDVDRHTGNGSSTLDASDGTVSGLVRVCRYASSLDYISSVLKEWGDQTFFLTLWEQLQKRGAEQPDPDVENDENGTLFSEVAAAYDRLRTRLLDSVVETVFSEFVDCLWQYERK